jgi:uncharacterized protein YbgA (DUF1722 family)
VGNVVDFHSRNKLLLMAHSPKHLKVMGKLVADGKAKECRPLYHEYEEQLLEALRLKTTTRKNVNVLQHMLGYFKKDLSADEKQELLEVIERYHRQLIPLVVPLTLFLHFVRKYDQPYLRQQTYLNPHPVELQLHNHV